MSHIQPRPNFGSGVDPRPAQRITRETAIRWFDQAKGPGPLELIPVCHPDAFFKVMIQGGRIELHCRDCGMIRAFFNPESKDWTI